MENERISPSGANIEVPSSPSRSAEENGRVSPPNIVIDDLPSPNNPLQPQDERTLPKNVNSARRARPKRRHRRRNNMVPVVPDEQTTAKNKKRNKRRKEMRRKAAARKQDSAASESAGLDSKLEETKSRLRDVESRLIAMEKSALCSVCSLTSVTHAFLPCGHLCCCATCSERLWSAPPCLCPLCSTPVLSPPQRIWLL